MYVYHGSTKIIESPTFGVGNPQNDYGLGFYCTESEEMAKEWAAFSMKGGFANHYELDVRGLKILNLTGGDFHILNWLAILIENREFSVSGEIATEAKEYILREFLPDYKDYDVITGYRADDSYFTFTKMFLNNGISLQKLEKAMTLGELGTQVVLKSEKAFDEIKFVDYSIVDGMTYYPLREKRDQEARDSFQKLKQEHSRKTDSFIIDILREEWKNDDPRIQRIILR